MAGETTQELRPEFKDETVAEALATVSNSESRLKDLMAAADTLVAYGALDEADTAIARLEQSGQQPSGLRRLKAASSQLRRSGILTSLRGIASDDSERFRGPQEILVYRCDKPTDRVILVFTGRARRFWLSLQVLHQFLKPFDSHIIYLTDNSQSLYFNGLQSIGSGYDGTLEAIDRAIKDLRGTRVFVMASSGGGFIGLRTAADLGAESFLGLSIRTNHAPDSTLPRVRRRRAVAPRRRVADPKLRIDLRPYLAAKGYPRRGLLVSGDSNPADVAHADNLRGLPNFEFVQLPGASEHNIVSVLLARRMFDGLLARFMGIGEGRE